MRIVYTGGGTGGHFYPLIAVAEQVNLVAEKEKVVDLKSYYFSNSPYDKNALFLNHLTFVHIPAGKIGGEPIKSFLALFQISFGFLKALWMLFLLYPDIVFSKGGYATLPTLLAARILRIPVFVHESDSVPGKANAWAGRFAKRVAVSFEIAGTFFRPKVVSWTGHPVRGALIHPVREVAFKYLGLDSELPVILVLGGSQGAEKINDAIISALPEILPKYQIIHQTGEIHFAQISGRAKLHFGSEDEAARYLPFAFLNDASLRAAAGAAALVISRAGSTIFEIAAWGLPSIIIPISESKGDHQRKNAYAYARGGACSVIEEKNLKPHLLAYEIETILGDQKKYGEMRSSAKKFFKPNAAEKIAEELVRIGLSHED